MSCWRTHIVLYAVLLLFISSCTNRNAPEETDDDLYDIEYACWKVIKEFAGGGSTTNYIYAKESDIEAEKQLFTDGSFSYERAETDDEDSCLKLDNLYGRIGTVNGTDYDNADLRCWELTFYSSAFSGTETTYSWNTEFGVVCWCEQFLSEYKTDDNTTYTYTETDVEDMNSCIQKAE